MSQSDLSGVNGSADDGGDAVREDPALRPEEKQFSIVGTKDDDRLTVYTEVASVGRSLRTHSEIEVTRERRVDGDIVGVEAKIPRNLLSIKGVPRSDESWHSIVSTGGEGS
jgi:hypothetical protein